MTLLRGRVALVTGAARGMGRSHALRLAEEGASVVLVDLPARRADTERTAAAVRGLGGAALVAAADVCDLAGLEAATEAAVDRFGALHGVVANAGVTTPRSPTWQVDPAEWARVLEINLTGVFNTCRATVPALLRAGSDTALVLIASAAAVAPMPLIAPYNAAKAGVLALSATLANELGPHGVRCNAVLPGSVDTPMTDDIAASAGTDRTEVLRRFVPRQLLPDIIRAADVSSAVAWLLSAQAAFVTGSTITVDAGLTANTGAPVGRAGAEGGTP